MTQLASQQETQQLEPQFLGALLKNLGPVVAKHGPDIAMKIFDMLADQPNAPVAPAASTPTDPTGQEDGVVDPQFLGALVGAVTTLGPPIVKAAIPLVAKHGPKIAKQVLDLLSAEAAGQMTTASTDPSGPQEEYFDPQFLGAIAEAVKAYGPEVGKLICRLPRTSGPVNAKQILDMFATEPTGHGSQSGAVESTTAEEGQLDPQFLGAVATAIGIFGPPIAKAAIPLVAKHGPKIAKQVLDMFTAEAPAHLSTFSTGPQQEEVFDPQFFDAIGKAISTYGPRIGKAVVPIALEHGPKIASQLLDMLSTDAAGNVAPLGALSDGAPTQQEEGQFDPQFLSAIGKAISTYGPRIGKAVLPIALEHGPKIATQILDMLNTEPVGHVQ